MSTATYQASSPAEVADRRILDGLADRDPNALAALYDQYGGYALAVAMRILRDRTEAEEVVQDAFWQIWTGHERYDPLRGRFRTWLFVITRSRALDRVRRKAGRVPTPDPAATADAGDRAPSVELSLDLQGSLRTLGEDQRTAIELAFYEGMTHAEIAERLGDSIGTVKSRIRRGLLRLKTTLDGTGGGS